MSWPATTCKQLDAAAGTLAFVRDFVTSIPLHPRRWWSDTAADSDLIDGLFWLLGYQFSPAGPTCPGLADLTGGHN